MTTIAIDVREACRPVRTGKGQWTFGFVSELLTREMPLVLLSDRELPETWKNHPKVRAVMFAPGTLWHFRVTAFLRREKNLVFVSPTSYIVPFLLRKSLSCVPIVHDLIAFRSEPHQWKARMIEKLTITRAAKHALHVCTVSNSTKKDLLHMIPELSADHVTSIFAAPMQSSAAKNQPDGKTILCIATLCPRKNQYRLIQAFAALSDHLRLSHRLVLAGSRGWHDDDIVQLAKETQGVELLGAVSDAQYESLLSTADVFALPSLYEGFGMQILDALQRGIPVLTSKRGSIPEVCGEAAEYVDPDSVSAISHGLEKILTDATRRAYLADMGPVAAARFSWKRTVDLFLECVHL